MLDWIRKKRNETISKAFPKEIRHTRKVASRRKYRRALE